MKTHTPGPWEATGPHPITHVAAIRAFGPVAAEIAAVISADVYAGNASLIAAAPDLLEACRSAQRYFDDMGPVLGETEASHDERMLRMQLQDAIAKAIAG